MLTCTQAGGEKQFLTLDDKENIVTNDGYVLIAYLHIYPCSFIALLINKIQRVQVGKFGLDAPSQAS